MIRRKANLNQPNTTPATGFVLGWLVKNDTAGNENMIMVFEDPSHGFVGEYPAAQIQFQDGCPDQIPTIE